jgi:hypothetical protein
MEISIIVAIIGLSLVSFAYADVWDKDVITVSIVDNNHNTEGRIMVIDYTITGEKIQKEKYAGWNHALRTLNGTAPQFKLVEDNGDIQITLLNHKSNKIYSGFTTFQSDYPGIISGAKITIFNIDEISRHELQMVMRHELGHSLGLGHSKESTDLMYPIIPYYTSYISQDNIKNIASLY